MTLDDKIRKFATDYRAMPKTEQNKLAEKVMAGVPHKRVRDFIVGDARYFPDKKRESVVVHVPSGFWKIFTLPYRDALRKMKDHPEADEELLQIMFAA